MLVKGGSRSPPNFFGDCWKHRVHWLQKPKNKLFVFLPKVCLVWKSRSFEGRLSSVAP